MIQVSFESHIPLVLKSIVFDLSHNLTNSMTIDQLFYTPLNKFNINKAWAKTKLLTSNNN